jgi:hypothetical protein
MLQKRIKLEMVAPISRSRTCAAHANKLKINGDGSRNISNIVGFIFIP